MAASYVKLLLIICIFGARGVIGNGSSYSGNDRMQLQAKPTNEDVQFLQTKRGNSRAFTNNLHRRTYENTCVDCQGGTCTCSDKTGVIAFPINSTGSTRYVFDQTAWSTAIEVMVRFNDTDVYFFNDTVCDITIGDFVLTSATDFHEINHIYISTADQVTLSRTVVAGCDVALTYAAIKPENEYIVLSNLTGSIALSGELNSSLGYPQQKRICWTFNFTDEDVNAVEFIIISLDLGWRNNDLHLMDINSSSNDMVIIGDDQNSKLTSYVFFGQLNKTKTVRVISRSPYVAFYGEYHEQYATGFNITYRAYVDAVPIVTTAVPVLTTTLPPIGTPPSAMAAINGASNEFINYTILDDQFRLSVSVMATEYIAVYNIDVQPPQNVTPEEVHVLEHESCLPAYCLSDCVAFTFDIRKINSEGDAWAFTSTDLEKIIRQKELQDAWQFINEDCEFCEENFTVNWLYIGVMSGVIVMAAAFAFMLLWTIVQKFEEYRDRDNATKLYNEDDTQLDARRRSSGDVSMIGTYKGSYFLSLPFKKHRDSVSSGAGSHFDLEYDISGFTEPLDYDDYIFEGGDPESRSGVIYSNPAFEPDSPTQRRRQEQLEYLQQRAAEDDRNHDKESTTTTATLSDVVQVLDPSTSKIHEPHPTNNVPFKSSLKKTNLDDQLKSKGQNFSPTLPTFQEENDDDSDGALNFDVTQGAESSTSF